MDLRTQFLASVIGAPSVSTRSHGKLARCRHPTWKDFLPYGKGERENFRLAFCVVDAFYALYTTLGLRHNMSQRGSYRGLIRSHLTRLFKTVLSKPGRHIPLLKRVAFECRNSALTGQPLPLGYLGVVLPKHFWRHLCSREALFQASMLGRALPPPGETHKKKAVEKTISLLTSEEDVLPLVWTDIEPFLASIGVHDEVTPRYELELTSTSASLDTPRSHGGRGTEVAQLTRLHFGSGRDIRRPGESSHEFCDRKQRQAAEALCSLPYSLESRTVPIPEWGWKTRVVSCSDAIRVHHSEAYRKELYKILLSVPCCRQALSDDDTFLPIENRDYTGKRYVYSADLSSATDLLSHKVIRAFSDALGVPFTLVAGGTVDGCTMVRGTLMGIPCSWPVLSLAHMYVCWAARIPVKSYHLKGDDLIGVWTVRQWERYRSLMQPLTGMRLNLAKTFRSVTHGTFCEKFYYLTEIGLVRYLTVYSLRALVRNDQELDEGPRALKVREYLWQFAGHARWRNLFHLAREYGSQRHVEPPMAFLPVKLGGLSALPRNLYAAAPWKLSDLVTNVIDGDLAAMRRVKSAYTASLPSRIGDKEGSARRKFLEEGAVYHRGPADPDLQSFLDADTALWARILYFTGHKPEPKNSFYSWEQITRRLDKDVEVTCRRPAPTWSVWAVRRELLRWNISRLDDPVMVLARRVAQARRK